jgi:hypothetical protein
MKNLMLVPCHMLINRQMDNKYDADVGTQPVPNQYRNKLATPNTSPHGHPHHQLPVTSTITPNSQHFVKKYFQKSFRFPLLQYLSHPPFPPLHTSN